MNENKWVSIAQVLLEKHLYKENGKEDNNN